MKDSLRKNALRADQAINWYRITDILGIGGFGITYLAEDENLLQQVAIKEYFPREWALRTDDGSVECSSEDFQKDFQWGMDRFISEGRILAKFDHPAIVRVMSVFEANRTAYLVMRFEQGATLKEVLKQTRELDEVGLKVMLRSLLDGLGQIHSSGVIHRDIKPDNIFLRRDGTPVLLDFGSARKAIGERTMDITTLVSSGYAPIEQYAEDEGKQGPWTDIYGLGATVYCAIMGNPPPDALVRSNGIINLSRDVMPSLADEKMEKYSYRFLKAIDHALAFKAADRPQTVAAWREELRLDDALETESGPNVSSVGPWSVMNVEVDKVDTGQWEIEGIETEDDASDDSRASIEDEYGFVVGDTRRRYYLRAFKALAARRFRQSWNWAAGVFTWPWLMYRKMYVWALVIFPPIAVVLVLLVDYFLPSVAGPQARTPLAVVGGYLAITTVLGGAFGNAVYRRHVIKKIRKARDLDLGDREREELLRLKGGVSLVFPTVAMTVLAAAAAGLVALTRGA
jgi:serine/threonine protein kinase